MAAILNGFSAMAAERVDNSTLQQKVMCGYQGWFRAPGDGISTQWIHYQHPSGNFQDGDCCIEYWPDMSETDDDEKFATPFRHRDGTPAFVFSSVNRKTILRHFKWMQDYGIDGIFLQRFATVVSLVDNNNRSDLDALDRVFAHCREGANQYGRTYAVMYDLSRMPAGSFDKVKEDWRALVRDVDVTRDPADHSYQYHKGKPVVGIWGVGLNDDRAYTSKECLDLINFFKNDPECGGCTVLIGTSLGWRTGELDAGAMKEWEPVYQAADIISPWTVGRFDSIPGAQQYVETCVKQDVEWCARHGIEFMPVVFPGFGWANLQKGISENAEAFIDRQDGRFLWAQYAALSKAGATMIYQAMFDEMDEGTQIFKVTDNPPNGKSRFKTYNGLPPDYYLWLVGQASGMMRGGIPYSESIPQRTETK